jgi:hypothetical protein
MNKTTESDIYKLIKKAVVNLKLNCFLTRIESGLTLNGIPDLYIVYNSKLINKTVNKPVAFWLEIKSNNLKNCNVSKYQINWILRVHSQKTLYCLIISDNLYLSLIIYVI